MKTKSQLSLAILTVILALLYFNQIRKKATFESKKTYPVDCKVVNDGFLIFFKLDAQKLLKSLSSVLISNHSDVFQENLRNEIGNWLSKKVFIRADTMIYNNNSGTEWMPKDTLIRFATKRDYWSFSSDLNPDYHLAISHCVTIIDVLDSNITYSKKIRTQADKWKNTDETKYLAKVDFYCHSRVIKESFLQREQYKFDDIIASDTAIIYSRYSPKTLGFNK
jgi:hypothetical protein